MKKIMILNIIRSKFQLKKIYKSIKNVLFRQIKIIIINNNKL